MTAPAANSAKTGAGLALGFGLAMFADLYGRAGLERLDAIFLAFLEVVDAGLHDRLIDARRDGVDRPGASGLASGARSPCRGFHRRSVQHRRRGPDASGAASRTGAVSCDEAIIRAATCDQGEDRRRCRKD